MIREVNRRTFGVAAAAAAAVGGTVPALAAAPDSLIFDALGEMRTTYDMALVDQILASGTRAIAVTLTDPKASAAEALPRFLADLEAYDAYYARHGDRFIRASKVADVERAVREGRLAVFYNLQDSTPVGADLDGVRRLRALGVTSIQLTYNSHNAAGSGCFEEIDGGVTSYGRELIARMRDEKVLLDLSHAGMRTMAEAIDAARAPMIVSHTACKALRAHRRNTTDENLRAVAAKGGVVGITQIRTFLTDARQDNLPVYFDHIVHALNLIGAEHVAIGSDRDHRVVPDTEEEIAILLQEEGVQFKPDEWPLYLQGLNGPRRMEVVADGLRRRGVGSADLDRIIGGNLYRLYQEVVG